ncbi:MAG: ATP-binding protein [Ktedonobacterales bacterium]|nr:ATP-binding protein [Ktedonobacterales bacterium]
MTHDALDERTAADATNVPRRPRSFKVYQANVPSLLTEPEVAAPECPRCHGHGYVRANVPQEHPLFGKAIRCACKAAEAEEQQRQQLWRLSNLEACAALTFTTFNQAIPGTQEAWRAALAYARDPAGWLVLGGPCGSGKTHLAAAIAVQRFAAGARVLFLLVPALLDHLRATFAPTSATTYDDLFARVRDADLLVLDDLGTEQSTPWAQDKLFQLINHRSIFSLPTVITTNLDLMRDLDDRIRSRLSDVRLVQAVRLTATDYRERPQPLSQREAS